MDNISIYEDSYVILNKKTPKSIISWITILIILFILSVIFFMIPFNIYKSFNGYVTIENHNSYLTLLLDKRDFPISSAYKLYIENTKYDYEIVNILEDQIILEVGLNEDIKINGNIVLVNVLKGRTTVFEIIKNKIKKGFGL